MILILLLFFQGCDKNGTDITPPEDNTAEISINQNKTFQEVESFGASDAWSIQFVGKNWPLEKKEKIADLLFSMESGPDGNPEGIALSSWRFNIGGGSAEQGSQSQIADEWRRAECFMDATGTFDWTKQAGQLWFLKEARKRGVDRFTGFVNSPPVSLTKNNRAWSEDGFSSNLKDDNYGLYANFLEKVVKGVATHSGVTFDYISPVNEPQWEWKCCGQEGSPWNNTEISKLVTSIDSAFVANKITTKIELTDAGQIDYLYESTGNPNRSNQINYFFNSASPGYLGDLPSVASHVAGHSYWTTWDLDRLVNSRQLLNQKLAAVDPYLHYHMTEYTLLENNEEVNGNGRDLGIDPALYMARVIHADLVFANASSWQWWLAVSSYDYKDGLIYVDYDKNNGSVYESKMLWAMGHYSRFIRPGMHRIETLRTPSQTVGESLNGLMESAYISESGEELIVVFVNYGMANEEVKFIGLADDFDTISIYQTTASPDDNLTLAKSVEINEVINIPKRGIITCVIK